MLTAPQGRLTCTAQSERWQAGQMQRLLSALPTAVAAAALPPARGQRLPHERGSALPATQGPELGTGSLALGPTPPNGV